MTVRPGKKFGFQSTAKNLQRRRWPNWPRQTVPDRWFTCQQNVAHPNSSYMAIWPGMSQVWRLRPTFKLPHYRWNFPL